MKKCHYLVPDNFFPDWDIALNSLPQRESYTTRGEHNERRTLSQVFREAFRKGQARTRLARHHNIHELIHMVPAMFCLCLFALPTVYWMTRESSEGQYAALLPATAYALALIVLGIQAAVVFRSQVVGIAIPLYAMLLHIGYGTGYSLAG